MRLLVKLCRGGASNDRFDLVLGAVEDDHFRDSARRRCKVVDRCFVVGAVCQETPEGFAWRSMTAGARFGAEVKVR